MARFGLIDLASAVLLRSTVCALAPPAGDALLDRARFPDLLPVGPWIVDLGSAPTVFQTWKRAGRFRSWGVFVESEADLPTLRLHFRHFNIVFLEQERKNVFFRYFDPRVLPAFLDAATPEQYASFFGPVQRIICEDRTAEAYRTFSANRPEQG